jgi:hypothetical protein
VFVLWHRFGDRKHLEGWEPILQTEHEQQAIAEMEKMPESDGEDRVVLPEGIEPDGHSQAA